MESISTELLKADQIENALICKETTLKLMDWRLLFIIAFINETSFMFIGLSATTRLADTRITSRD